MNSQELTTVLIDEYMNLHRILTSEDRDAQINYQLKGIRHKLEAMGIAASDLDLCRPPAHRKEGDRMPEDIRYRDQLRKDLIDYELIADFLKDGETEKALALINKHIERIRSSLQG